MNNRSKYNLIQFIQRAAFRTAVILILVLVIILMAMHSKPEYMRPGFYVSTGTTEVVQNPYAASVTAPDNDYEVVHRPPPNESNPDESDPLLALPNDYDVQNNLPQDDMITTYIPAGNSTQNTQNTQSPQDAIMQEGVIPETDVNTFDDPDFAEEPEVIRFLKEISDNIRDPAPEMMPSGIFTWPLERPGAITSSFGLRKDPFSGEREYHVAIDIGAATGTPILAAADGVVLIANGIYPSKGWGYYVKISHDDGFETLYAHCSAIAVEVGDYVERGQIIGYVGSSGRSIGPHLHWEVYEGGVLKNPLLFFN